MKHLIDKDTLVTEIEECKNESKLQDIKTIETIKTLGNYSEKEKEKYYV